MTALAFGLVSVIVSTEVSLVPIEAGVKLFATPRPPRTVSVAFAAAVLGPALAVVSTPLAMVLAYVPPAALVTFTVTVHEPLAGIVPPESATLLPLFAAVTVPPAHVVAPPAAPRFTRPAGYVSVNAAPVIAVAFGLVSVMVSAEVPFTPIAAGANALAIVGLREHRERGGGAAAAVPALVVVTAPVELR